MEPVTVDGLRAFANGLDGQTPVTRQRERPFALRVTEKGFEYTPEWSGTPRMQLWHWVERTLNRFNETRSLHPTD